VPAAERKVKIRNRYGLHGRPTTMFVNLARTFACAVTVSRDDDPEEVDGKSAIGILSLGLERGGVLRIAVRGADAPEAIAALVDLVKSNFSEE
jgi:phosphotransferase system HPr (HPr) family protein